jgi:hypothetical protein
MWTVARTSKERKRKSSGTKTARVLLVQHHEEEEEEEEEDDDDDDDDDDAATALVLGRHRHGLRLGGPSLEADPKGLSQDHLCRNQGKLSLPLISHNAVGRGLGITMVPNLIDVGAKPTKPAGEALGFLVVKARSHKKGLPCLVLMRLLANCF